MNVVAVLDKWRFLIEFQIDLITGQRWMEAYRLAWRARLYPILHTNFVFMKSIEGGRLVFIKAIELYTDKKFYLNAPGDRIPNCQADTYVSYLGKSSFQTDTDLVESDEDVTPLCTFKLRCAVVDRTSRKVLKVSDLGQKAPLKKDAKPLQLTLPKRPAEFFKAERVVARDHLDSNEHMNINNYIYLSMDCVEQAFADGYFTGHDIWLHPVNMQVKTLSILFENEAVLNETLTFHIWLEVVDNETLLHIHLSKDNKDVTSLSMTFHNSATNSQL